MLNGINKLNNILDNKEMDFYKFLNNKNSYNNKYKSNPDYEKLYFTTIKN